MLLHILYPHNWHAAKSEFSLRSTPFQPCASIYKRTNTIPCPKTIFGSEAVLFTRSFVWFFGSDSKEALLNYIHIILGFMLSSTTFFKIIAKNLKPAYCFQWAGLKTSLMLTETLRSQIPKGCREAPFRFMLTIITHRNFHYLLYLIQSYTLYPVREQLFWNYFHALPQRLPRRVYPWLDTTSF